MTEPLSLNVRFERSESQLTVEYDVENGSAASVYLTNHGVTYGPQGPVPDRNQIWVLFENGTVHLTQRQPWSPGDGFRQPIPHFVTPVPPGKKFHHRLSLPLPLVEVRPYKESPPSGAHRVHRAALFTVGYRSADERFVPTELTRAGHHVWVLRSILRDAGKRPPGPLRAPVEEFLRSEPVPIELPVIEPAW